MRLELDITVFQTSTANIIYDVVLEVRLNILRELVLCLVAQEPDLQTVAIYTVIFRFLHQPDAGDALCLVVSHALTIPTDHVHDERFPN